MPNMILSHRNRADAATLSGGSWLAARPLSNLQSRFLSKVARSSDATTASTLLDCDFGAAMAIRVVALRFTNLSLNATIKIQLRTATAGGGTLVAGHSDFVAIWPAMYAGSPDRQPTAEEAEDLPKLFLLVLEAEVEARFLRIEIVDTANADGYVELSRLWAGPAWQPERNFTYGAEFGLTDDTETSESPAGAVFAGTTRKRRTMSLSLDWLDLDEGFQQALDITYRLGQTGQLLACASPDESDLNRLRTTMLATLEPSALSLPQYGISSMKFSFTEVIA